MNAAQNDAIGETSTCPWCSAAVPAEAARCPSCGAALRDGVDDEVPGVTQVDLKATSRLARLKPPGRVAMWLGAERTTEDPALSGRIEPPSEEVRQEMLRLELAALEAEIEVKTTLAEAQRSLPPEDGGEALPNGDAAAPAGDGSPTPVSSDVAAPVAEAAAAPDAAGAAAAPDAAEAADAPDPSDDRDAPEGGDPPDTRPG
jgi:hypothetical protein